MIIGRGIFALDISLERILSLIPKKPDGKFQHGELKKFANSIGLKSGNLISDWMNGRSASYENYIYEISEKYNVSVEWLKGETDIKEKPAPTNGSEFLEKFGKLPPEKQQLVMELIEGLLEK